MGKNCPLSSTSHISLSRLNSLLGTILHLAQTNINLKWSINDKKKMPSYCATIWLHRGCSSTGTERLPIPSNPQLVVTFETDKITNYTLCYEHRFQTMDWNPDFIGKYFEESRNCQHLSSMQWKEKLVIASEGSLCVCVWLDWGTHFVACKGFHKIKSFQRVKLFFTYPRYWLLWPIPRTSREQRFTLCFPDLGKKQRKTYFRKCNRKYSLHPFLEFAPFILHGTEFQSGVPISGIPISGWNLEFSHNYHQSPNDRYQFPWKKWEL